MIIKKTQCTVCSHLSHEQINAELTAGASARDIAAKYFLSKSSVARHMALHGLRNGATGQSDADARQLEDAARRLLAASERKGDRRSQLDALKLLHEMQIRRRIAAASASVPTPSPEQPDAEGQPKPNGEWSIHIIEDPPKRFLDKIHEIYNIRPAFASARARFEAVKEIEMNHEREQVRGAARRLRLLLANLDPDSDAEPGETDINREPPKRSLE